MNYKPSGDVLTKLYAKELLRLSQPLRSLGKCPKYWRHKTLAKVLCALIGHHIIKIPDENKHGIFNPYHGWEKYCDRCGKAFIIHDEPLIKGKTIKFRRY